MSYFRRSNYGSNSFYSAYSSPDYEKLKVIADHNGRSVNKEIEQILKWIIDDFENKCGKIRTEELDLIDHPEKKAKIEPVKDRPMDMLFKL